MISDPFERPAAFSLILEGLPHPATGYPCDPAREKLRARLGTLLDHKYSKNTMGSLVTAFTTGQQRYMPHDQDLIVPIPEHGVTFPNPSAIIDCAIPTPKGWSNLRCALSDVVVSAVANFSELQLSLASEGISAVKPEPPS